VFDANLIGVALAMASFRRRRALAGNAFPCFSTRQTRFALASIGFVLRFPSVRKTPAASAGGYELAHGRRAESG